MSKESKSLMLMKAGISEYYDQEDWDIIKQALKRNEPMKPVHASLYYNEDKYRGMYACEACKSLIHINQYDKPNYCQNCGQRLDWNG